MPLHSKIWLCSRYMLLYLLILDWNGPSIWWLCIDSINYVKHFSPSPHQKKKIDWKNSQYKFMLQWPSEHTMCVRQTENSIILPCEWFSLNRSPRNDWKLHFIMYILCSFAIAKYAYNNFRLKKMPSNRAICINKIYIYEEAIIWFTRIHPSSRVLDTICFFSMCSDKFSSSCVCRSIYVCADSHTPGKNSEMEMRYLVVYGILHKWSAPQLKKESYLLLNFRLHTRRWWSSSSCLLLPNVFHIDCYG